MVNPVDEFWRSSLRVMTLNFSLESTTPPHTQNKTNKQQKPRELHGKIQTSLTLPQGNYFAFPLQEKKGLPGREEKVSGARSL